MMSRCPSILGISGATKAGIDQDMRIPPASVMGNFWMTFKLAWKELGMRLFSTVHSGIKGGQVRGVWGITQMD